DAGRIATNCIGRTTNEAGRWLAIEPNNVALAVHLDLIAVPLLGRQIGAVLIILLAGPGSQSPDLVDGASPGKERAVGLAKSSVAAGLLVDLNFISSMYCGEGRVIRRIDGIGRRIGQSRVAEADEHTRVVVVVAARVRQQEIDSQNKVFEGLPFVKQ